MVLIKLIIPFPIVSYGSPLFDQQKFTGATGRAFLFKKVWVSIENVICMKYMGTSECWGEWLTLWVLSKGEKEKRYTPSYLILCNPEYMLWHEGILWASRGLSCCFTTLSVLLKGLWPACKDLYLTNSHLVWQSLHSHKNLLFKTFPWQTFVKHLPWSQKLSMCKSCQIPPIQC